MGYEIEKKIKFIIIPSKINSNKENRNEIQRH